MKLLLRSVRLSFPQLWEAAQVKEGEGKPAYSAAFLLPVDHPQIDEINAAIDAAGVEKWKEKGPATVAQLRAQDRVCLHNGDFKQQYDGYPGNWFINARNEAKPLVIDRIPKKADGSANVLTEKDGRPYGGCYVNASIEIYAQDHPKGGKRVNASLKGIQFVEDGDAFSGGPPATPDDFPDDLAVDAGDLA
jgi:ssDNA-binding protein